MGSRVEVTSLFILGREDGRLDSNPWTLLCHGGGDDTLFNAISKSSSLILLLLFLFFITNTSVFYLFLIYFFVPLLHVHSKCSYAYIIEKEGEGGEEGERGGKKGGKGEWEPIAKCYYVLNFLSQFLGL